MTIAELMTDGAKFDCAMNSAASWRRDASLYSGRRRELRIEHAERMESIAERLVKEA